MLLNKKSKTSCVVQLLNSLPIYIQSIFEFDTHLVLGVGYKESRSFTFQNLHLIMCICSLLNTYELQ